MAKSRHTLGGCSVLLITYFCYVITMMASCKPWKLKSRSESVGSYISKALADIAGWGPNFLGMPRTLVLQVECMNDHTWAYIDIDKREFWAKTNEMSNIINSKFPFLIFLIMRSSKIICAMQLLNKGSWVPKRSQLGICEPMSLCTEVVFFLCGGNNYVGRRTTVSGTSYRTWSSLTLLRLRVIWAACLLLPFFIIQCCVAESIRLWEYSALYRLLSSPGYAPMQAMLHL